MITTGEWAGGAGDFVSFFFLPECNYPLMINS